MDPKNTFESSHKVFLTLRSQKCICWYNGRTPQRCKSHSHRVLLADQLICFFAWSYLPSTPTAHDSLTDVSILRLSQASPVSLKQTSNNNSTCISENEQSVMFFRYRVQITRYRESVNPNWKTETNIMCTIYSKIKYFWKISPFGWGERRTFQQTWPLDWPHTKLVSPLSWSLAWMDQNPFKSSQNVLKILLSQKCLSWEITWQNKVIVYSCVMAALTQKREKNYRHCVVSRPTLPCLWSKLAKINRPL